MNTFWLGFVTGAVPFLLTTIIVVVLLNREFNCWKTETDRLVRNYRTACDQLVDASKFERDAKLWAERYSDMYYAMQETMQRHLYHVPRKDQP